jgi:hypothetical protein
VTREELMFSRFIEVLRSSFIEILTKPLWIQMCLEFPELKDRPEFKADISIKYNKDNLYEEWKILHDYLANKDYTEGTWAEGFEIGVAAIMAGFKPQNLDWSHHIFSKMIGYNGYKTGHKSEK